MKPKKPENGITKWEGEIARVKTFHKEENNA